MTSTSVTSPLKLSAIVVDGLRNLNTSISTDLTKKLILNAVKMALHSDENIPANPEIYATKADYTKQAEFAVLSLIILSIKHNLDGNQLRAILKEYQISELVTEELTKIYINNKQELRLKNFLTANSLAHFSNLEWKLSCDIKSSQDLCSGELVYTISLGKYNEQSGERESIADFVCNVEELQAFISALKDISKHCVKLSGNS